METSTAVKGVVLAADDGMDVRRQKVARIILDAMYQFLGLLDENGIVLEINQSALDGAGVSLEDVIGKPFWEARWWAVSDESRLRVKEMVGRARNGEFVRCDIEVYGAYKGEKTIFVDFSLTPIRDETGKVAFLLPEGRDISQKIDIEAALIRKNEELQSALEKLREIDGFKTRFFANVSHELRTPLTLILGPLDQLLKEGGPYSEREQFQLSTARRNARALLQQVNDLLDLARIDDQKMPLAYVRTNAGALIKEVAATFASVAEEKSIDLVIYSDEGPQADIDRAKIVRIVTNLLSNAFKFTPRGGRITCTLEKLPSQRLLLSVQDNGPGIPLAQKAGIFARFAQGQEGMKTTGSGLGLNIVKEFVELHHGTVVVLDAPGGGAVFQVELPLRAPDGVFVRDVSDNEPLAAYEEYAPADGHIQGYVGKRADVSNLLVVEDNPDLRHFLHDVLVDEYNVTLVSDGTGALAVLESQPPDLVITDLMMPDMDGEHLIRELRSRIQFRNIPVLVLSARADDSLRASLLKERVQDYLTKPFSPQELRARVKNLVTVKHTIDILQKELNSQASDVHELTANLVASRQSLLDSLLALKISERRWESIFHNTDVGVALMDRNGRILKANPALQSMLAYDEREIVGISFVDITEASFRDMARTSVRDIAEGRTSNYHAQRRYEKKDGQFLWANICVSLIPSVDPEGPQLVVIVEDITSRKLAEAALTSTQAELARVSRFTAMGELVASIAHEVNQPLTAILTNSQAALRWLNRETPDYTEVAAALHRVNRDATLAGGVISRIRAFLSRGGMKRIHISPHQVMDDLLSMLQSSLQEDQVRCHVSIAPELPDLFADQIQLQQVLMNLILNAVEAMREVPWEERQLRIILANGGADGVVFTVADAGPGIPSALRESVFGALFSTKKDGLGMGLAISRSIVEGHGGRLRLESGPLRGANFVFNIPPWE